MAITSTLSRLKNYFIGWHTANYETLHLLTDEITDEEPLGSYAIRSRAIKDLMGDKNDTEGDTIWGNINRLWNSITELWNSITELWNNVGNKCKISYYNENDVWTSDDIGGTLWSNICDIWNTIGRLSDYNVEVNSVAPRRESIWGWIAWLRYGDDALGYWSDWYGGEWGGEIIPSLGRKKHSALGWIHKFSEGIDKSVVLKTYFDKFDGEGWIKLWRKGDFVHVHGYFKPTIVREKNTFSMFKGSGEWWYEGQRFLELFIPKTSTYFNFSETQANEDLYSVQIQNENDDYFEFLYTCKKNWDPGNNKGFYFSGVYMADKPMERYPNFTGYYRRDAYYINDARTLYYVVYHKDDDNNKEWLWDKTYDV